MHCGTFPPQASNDRQPESSLCISFSKRACVKKCAYKGQKASSRVSYPSQFVLQKVEGGGPPFDFFFFFLDATREQDAAWAGVNFWVLSYTFCIGWARTEEAFPRFSEVVRDLQLAHRHLSLL